MAKSKKPEPLFEHRMGVRSGYNVYPDGSIELAPMWLDQMDEICAREIGLREMQHGVNVYVADQFTHLAKQRKRWWDRVFEELGMERGNGEQWQLSNGVLKKATPSTEETDAEEAGS